MVRAVMRRTSPIFAVFLLACIPEATHRGPERADTVTLRINEGTALTFDVTPDGGSLVIDLLGQLWLLQVDGGVARPLKASNEPVDDREPTVSPDGVWIATRSDRAGGRGIWLHSIAGDVHRPLTDSAQLLGNDVSAPAWSRDGLRVAYVQRGTIHQVEVATGARAPLFPRDASAGWFDEPAWSPDGRHLLVSGPWSGGGARALLEGAIGAPIQEVDLETQTVREVTPAGTQARAPAWSPDGRSIAYFEGDSSRAYRIVVQPERGAARVLTSEPAIEPRRLRWSTDGSEIFFVAGGRLRAVAGDGGHSREVAFDAELAVKPAAYTRRALEIGAPGETVSARGFSGIALAPDGRTVALLALGRLWLVARDRAAHAVIPVGAAVAELTFSPDGRELAWTAGLPSEEDVWAADVGTGVVRRVTSMPGSEAKIAWSPDGRWIAFLHWPPSGSPGAPENGDEGVHVRLVEAGRGEAGGLDATRSIGTLPWSETAAFASSLQWLPGSDAVLAYGMNTWPVISRVCVEAKLFGLDGDVRDVTEFPCRPSHAVIAADGALVAVEDGRITRRGRTTKGWGLPATVSSDAGLYPRAALDGTLLYVTRDGLRLRAPDGTETQLGWPLSFVTPEAPPLLLKNVHVVALDARADTTLKDVLVTNGRIQKIAAAGTLSLPRRAGGRVHDAVGRWLMPGLIDTHTHLMGGGVAVARAALFHGVTTLREMWHPLAEAAAFRDDIAAGVVDGARVVVSGPPFYPSPSGVSVSSDFLWIPVDSATTERGLSLLEAFGAGHAKMRYVQGWTGGALFVRLAHAHGIAVSGHCAHTLAMIDAGMDGHEHTDGQCGDWEYGIHDDIAQLYRAAGTAAAPVIDLHQEAVRIARDSVRMKALDANAFMTPGLRDAARGSDDPAWLARLDRRAARARTNARVLHAAGVPIILGTDAAMYPGAVHRELADLVAAGFTPRDALRAATVHAASAIGAAEQLGRVTPGYIADLVLLDGDPLEDISNTTRIAEVIQAGRVIDRNALRAARELASQN